MLVQPATVAPYDAADVAVVPYTESQAQVGGQAGEGVLRLWSTDVMLSQYLEVYQATIDIPYLAP